MKSYRGSVNSKYALAYWGTNVMDSSLVGKAMAKNHLDGTSVESYMLRKPL